MVWGYCEKPADEYERGKSGSQEERSTPSCGRPLSQDAADLKTNGSTNGSASRESCESDRTCTRGRESVCENSELKEAEVNNRRNKRY